LAKVKVGNVGKCSDARTMDDSAALTDVVSLSP
jgi:hypothetical protein